MACLNQPWCKTALSEANKHHQKALVGATWLPMSFYILPMSPLPRGLSEVSWIFQPTHAALKASKSSPGTSGG